MKHIQTCLALVLLLCAGHIKSQDIPPPNPGLVINIVTGYSILFVFDEVSEYQNGIMGGGQSTFIRIGSIYDWKLQFKADQPIFYGTGNPSNQMELNNVGLIVVSVGSNQDDGSNIINYAKTVPVALESNDVTILTKGALSNKGYGTRNSFSLDWEMGTMRGNMKSESMLEQMLPADSYTLNIILTLSVY
jgi:hypothetical protein